jgi:hypothetical protein
MMNSAGPRAQRFSRSGKQRTSLNRRKCWRHWVMVLPLIELSGGDGAKERCDTVAQIGSSIPKNRQAFAVVMAAIFSGGNP